MKEYFLMRMNYLQERNNTMIDDVEVNVIGEELLLFQVYTFKI